MTESPLPPIALSTRVRRSPFFEATLRAGVKSFTVYNRMFMPAGFDTPQAEFRKLVEEVTLWDVAAERQVEITGPDAARFTQYLTPRNLSRLRPGRCRYVLITAGDGGIVNDPVLLKLAEDHFWLSLADSDVLLYAKGLAVAAGMDVRLREPDVSPLQVQGPKALDVMCTVFGEWVRELRYFQLRETRLGSIPVVVARTGWSGERGYEVFLRDGSRGDELWETIMAAGAPYGIAPIAPSQIRRIEAGMISYGADVTVEDNPFEAGLDRLVDLDMAPDYVGKAALARIEAAGVTRRLVGVEIEAGPFHAYVGDRWRVHSKGGDCGYLTSAIYSPRLEKNIGLAMIHRPHCSSGTELELRAPHGSFPIRVAATPFFDPEKAIARA